MMMTLTYRSDAAALLPFSALADICFRSAVRNQELGITGFLVEHEGTFLQVLEGEPETVERLFERIAADPRHGNVTVLMREISDDQRSFGFWAMNFGPLNDPTFWEGDLKPFATPESFKRASHSPDIALRVLTHAYGYACILADADPVIGDFVKGELPSFTPTRQGS